MKPVPYHLDLPPELAKIHNVFHVSMLQWYKSNPSYILTREEIELRPDWSYEEELVEFLAQEVKQLRNKSVSLVNVL